MRMFFQFLCMTEQAKEIEQEWQRIQQDEHDFFFAFQVTRNDDAKAEYMYKKGIADGIKWAISRFS